MGSETKIMYSSDEAAKYTTNLSGWVDRNGFFFGEDEHIARYSGCTHRVCEECEEVEVIKGYIKCPSCIEKGKIERYGKKITKEWDGLTPVYSDAADLFFFEEEDLINHLEDTGDSPDSLRLVLCTPVKFQEFDEDVFCDELAEDQELPEKLTAALDVLNKVIRDLPASSWEPSKHAVTYGIKEDKDGTDKA